MEFWKKLIIAVIAISSTIIGSLWTAFTVNDARMDYKDQAIKKEIMTTIHHFRDERNALMKAQDDKTSVQIAALNTSFIEVKKDVRAILGIARRRQVFVDKQGKTLYTILESSENKGNRL